MTTHLISTTAGRRTLNVGMFLVLSVLSSLVLHSPTHAVSPASTVLANVANVATALPVVSPIVSSTTTSTVPAVTVAPVDAVLTNPVVTTVATSNPVAPTVTPTTQQAATSTSAAPTTTDVTTNTVTYETPYTSGLVQAAAVPATPAFDDLSTLTKESEIAAASTHTAGSPLTYTSRTIDPKIARGLFYIGITGLLIGGYLMLPTKRNLVVAK